MKLARPYPLALLLALCSCSQSSDLMVHATTVVSAPKASPEFPSKVINNPDGTSDVLFPSREHFATATYEDLFPHPGDADYNDFVFNFSIQEHFNNKNQLEKILIEIVPRHLGAGYDHSLLLIADGKKDLPSNIDFVSKPMFTGGAKMKLETIVDGKVTDTTDFSSADDDLILFSSTQAIFKKASLPTLHLTISMTDPTANTVAQVSPIDLSKYRFILHVKNTSKDIDLTTVNPDVLFSDNFPFGLVVPIDWKWPKESIHIDTVYSNFKSYREWLADGRASTPPTETLQWYDYVTAGAEANVENK